MSHKGWTCFQDTLLLQAYEKYQDKWQFISTAFPGKTALECAARYKTLSERGEATLSDYQFRKNVNTDWKRRVKKEFIMKPSPFALASSIVDHSHKKVIFNYLSKALKVKTQSQNVQVKNEPIESFLDYFAASNLETNHHLEGNALVNEPYSDLLNCPDEEIEKRHEFSSVKIPSIEYSKLIIRMGT